MKISMAHLRERAQSGAWINFAVFDAKPRTETRIVFSTPYAPSPRYWSPRGSVGTGLQRAWAAAVLRDAHW
jgi:hypothetical protein